MKDATELTGKRAPTFKAPVIGGGYEEGATVSLADLKGQTVVLYFYPKDDTPGWTTQACALRDGWRRIQKRAAVFGVSVDSLKSHAKFIKKHSLPFPLISISNPDLVERFANGWELNPPADLKVGSAPTAQGHTDFPFHPSTSRQ